MPVKARVLTLKEAIHKTRYFPVSNVRGIHRVYRSLYMYLYSSIYSEITRQNIRNSYVRYMFYLFCLVCPFNANA